MHKFFAKTLFAGKKHHFLTHCHSTNDILLEMARKETLPEGFLVTTSYQSQGKGQRGNVWISESGKNVLSSILFKPKFLNIKHQHLLTFMPALAISDAINALPLYQKSKIKWPNDVLIGNKKIAGILTECSIQSSLIEQAVIGFGINVNQDTKDIPEATSILSEIGYEVDLEDFLESVLVFLEKYYFELKGGKFQEILDNLTSRLYGLNEEKTYVVGNSKRTGIIRGIDQNGRLEVEMDGVFRIFNLKEIKYIR